MINMHPLDTTTLIKVIATTIIFLTGFFVISDTVNQGIKSRAPVIQQVGVPFYFTNTIVVLIPTNSIPLTNVVTKP